MIATNLSCILARRGFSVTLLDLDFRAPSLSVIFSKATNNQVDCYLNDFLNSKCDQKQVTIDVSGSYNFKGRLQVGLANPSVPAVQSVTDKSQAWELSAVKKLFSLISYFEKNLIADYCILDTSPGIQYSSINALAASDLCLLVMNSDMVDLEVTRNLLTEVADALNKKTAIVLNKSSPETHLNEAQENDAAKRIEAVLKHPVVSTIPCYCDVLQADRMTLLAVEKPTHPFIKRLEVVADKIDSL